ncbi:hypothetical protein H310_11284 [Aphanomyces invadans]|uniref:Uncharacterized protein n=1 Tax=Aphanomyces invadans TaxID=157072 RepID=A0A024TN61_9STRA|nr:hypothetical protein H310_11284 [Aphanomyces invadans]ETV95409.1 hypothetical protein H310_11284 [Aphanomyces invadans]|eukprot:XP_008876110.1 hypothetical protein H310_11284 [Aphanomyces invadans]
MANKLPSKENALFRSIVKCYEIKQYKKGLKAADAILKKFPDHGETLAMKGLTLNCMGKKEEAYEFVRQGVKQDLKSHVCWHVYGLLYRSDRNYAEAIKCYRQALRIDPDNIQILRDLYLQQVQMRDLKGYAETRRQFLALKPTNRNNWIGLAIAHQLNGTYDTAIDILDQYNDTLSPTREGTYDDSEMYLYQNELIEEKGDLERCLAHLETIKPFVLDTLVWRQRKADMLVKLGQFDDAVAIYQELLDINGDHYHYHRGIQAALCRRPDWLALKSVPSATEALTADETSVLLNIYQGNSSPTYARLSLDLLSGAVLETSLDEYLRRGLKKGIPSLGSDIKVLYTASTKRDILSKLIATYLSEEASTGPSEWVWRLYLAAQHYDRLRDIPQALKYIDLCLKHTPTVLEFYQKKARILKHAGDYNAAATVVDQGRRLDLADRYINNKTTKYLMRANRIAEAESTIALFTRHEGDPQQNLYDMQCMWYELAAGAAQFRQRHAGPALKKFAAVEKHFNDFLDDQFDFHSYCMRKMTLRAYVQMLRMCDTLLGHPVYVQAAHGAIAVHVQRHDELTAPSPSANASGAKLSAADKAKAKRAAAKARKAEFQKAEEAKVASQLQKEQEALEKAADKTKKKNQSRPKDAVVDPDPLGEQLVAKSNLEEAWRIVTILQQYAPTDIQTHVAAFDVAYRREKWLLCLQALVAAHAIEPSHPKTLVRLVQLYTKSAPTSGIVESLLQEGKSVLFHGLKDIAAVVKDAAAKHTTLEWRVAVAEAACVAEGSASLKADAVTLWLEDKGKSSLAVYENAVAVVNKYGCQKDQDTFKQTAKTWFPYAALFGNKYELTP